MYIILYPKDKLFIALCIKISKEQKYRTKLLKRQQTNDFEKNEEQATPTTFYNKKREKRKKKIKQFFSSILYCVIFIHITNDK